MYLVIRVSWKVNGRRAGFTIRAAFLWTEKRNHKLQKNPSWKLWCYEASPLSLGPRVRGNKDSNVLNLPARARLVVRASVRERCNATRHLLSFLNSTAGLRGATPRGLRGRSPPSIFSRVFEFIEFIRSSESRKSRLESTPTLRRRPRNVLKRKRRIQ